MCKQNSASGTGLFVDHNNTCFLHMAPFFLALKYGMFLTIVTSLETNQKLFFLLECAKIS